ncbi:RNA-binding region-containing protein 3 isoform X1 [Denticeps clupeoides]|uniref:RNA-binding region-containing protein 3 n=1 Tax=Denticeps clupeoides TaxID=299321 RepID=A0AAY4D4E9_9TELE|nr:RNA-binding region-containing protein 3 isoform X1 [Denticeps clupeoides]XP_028823516.1 RNA-binding region-containing protein 3 isoform X1 [Denticeps clupeoides]
MADPEDVKAQPKQIRTLIVRHLPAELTRDEKEDFLKYFGATCVRIMSDKGALKHTAFASFDSEGSAAKALTRLHQMKLLGHTLVVEFAKDQENVIVLKNPPIANSASNGQQKKGRPQENIPLIETGIAPKLGLKFQINPSLKYLFPPPSSGVLTNIAHALLSVPKFYVQVLHLMNKMNLPCPFGPITPRPPVFDLFPTPPIAMVPMPPPYPPENPPLPEEGLDGSEEESEYESEDDEEKERILRVIGLNQPCKRPARTKSSAQRKKPKLKDLLYTPKPESHSTPAQTLQPCDVFDQPQTLGTKKIELHIPAEVSAGQDQQEEEEHEAVTDETTDGFGKLYPTAQAPPQEEDGEEDDDIPSDFISRKELEKGRLSREEIKRMSVFKNYEPGEATCRLYVKNISKQVEEKDLKYIYGRYINVTSEAERNMFDIVLMKEGRMKGQAFIGLPSEKSAERALRDTNGYVLHDKPLIVQFARSAKPKPDAAESKKGGKRQ